MRANFVNFYVDVASMTKKKELIEQPKENTTKVIHTFLVIKVCKPGTFYLYPSMAETVFLGKLRQQTGAKLIQKQPF